MANNLRILLVLFSIGLFAITFTLIYRKKIPINISLFWLLSALIIMILGIFPNFINFFTKIVGFETTSNFIIGIILTILLLNTLLLTIVINEQNKKITLLIQEVSILKEKGSRDK